MKRLLITLIGKNRRAPLFFLFLVSFLLDLTNVYALDLFGPPAAEAKKWKLNTGFEYSVSSMDLTLINGKWKEKIDGVTTDSGQAADIPINDIESNKMSVYIGYGIEQNWEAFVRLGAANTEFGHSQLEETGKFDSDYVPSVGIGMKMTFYNDYRLQIGGIAQAGWAKHDGQINPTQFDTPSFVSIDLMEAQFALGALYRWTNYLSFYGGPIYYYVTGEFEDNFTNFNEIEAEFVNSEYKWDFENNSDYGGYLGTCINLTENFSLNLEYQLTGDADVMGANIVWKF